MSGWLTIGAVALCEPGCDAEHCAGRCHPGGVDDAVMGEVRLVALRAFHRREPIPGGYVPRADWHHGSRRLRWEDVDWDTAGERVTGPGR